MTEMIDQLPQTAMIVGALFFINQSLKEIGMPTKFAPIVNIIVGGLLGVYFFQGDSVTGFLLGVTAGATAGGLYDLKSVVKKEDPTKSNNGIYS